MARKAVKPVVGKDVELATAVATSRFFVSNAEAAEHRSQFVEERYDRAREREAALLAWYAVVAREATPA